MNVGTGLALSLLLLTLVGLGLSSGERATFTGEYSSFSAGPSGARGMFELSEALGKAPARLMTDFEKLPASGAVVSISPRIKRATLSSVLQEPVLFTEYELDALQRWVASGNTLVVFHHAPSALLARFGLKQERGPAAVDEKAAGEVPEGGAGWPPITEPATLELTSLVWLRGVSSVEVEADVSGVTLAPSSTPSAPAEGQVLGFAPLLLTQDGRVVSAEVSFGAGRFVWVGSPYVASNHGVMQGDNGLFLARLLAREEKIYIDEYHHGFEHSRSLSGYLKESGLWLVGCQLLFVLICLWWRVSRGFGGVGRSEAPGSRSSGDYLRAMSLIYQRGRHYGHAVDVLLRELERALVEVRALPGETTRADLEESLRQRGHEADAVKVAALLERSRKEALSGRASVALAMKITEYTATLRGEGS